MHVPWPQSTLDMTFAILANVIAIAVISYVASESQHLEHFGV